MSASIYSHVEDYMISTIPNEEDSSRCKKFCNLKTFIRGLVFGVCLYNILFIPICLGYRVKFEGVHLVMEIVTIISYLIDTCIRWSTLSSL